MQEQTDITNPTQYNLDKIRADSEHGAPLGSIPDKPYIALSGIAKGGVADIALNALNDPKLENSDNIFLLVWGGLIKITKTVEGIELSFKQALVNDTITWKAPREKAKDSNPNPSINTTEYETFTRPVNRNITYTKEDLDKLKIYIVRLTELKKQLNTAQITEDQYKEQYGLLFKGDIDTPKSKDQSKYLKYFPKLIRNLFSKLGISRSNYSNES